LVGELVDGGEYGGVDELAEEFALGVVGRGGGGEEPFGGARAPVRVGARGLLEDLVVAHAAFPLPEEGVAADGKEPALCAGSRRVLVPCAVCAQEGLLDEVFRIRRGAGEA